MNRIHARLASTLGACALLAAGSAHAGASGGSAHADQATLLGTGKTIHVYRLPTTDIDGTVQFYDLQLNLPIGDDGSLGDSAKITATASPTFVGNNFVAGTYGTSAYLMTCVLGVSMLIDGRESVGMNCTGSGSYASYYIMFAWATGPIKGHPFETTLRAAGIDKIGGYQDYGWGVVESEYGASFGCMTNGDVISATQSGNVVTVTDYGHSNVARCGAAFTLKS